MEKSENRNWKSLTDFQISLKAYNLLFELIRIELQKLVHPKMSLYTRVLKLGAVKAHRGRERCFEFKSLILFFLKQKWQFSHSLKAKSVTFSQKKKCQKQPDLNKSSTFVSNEMFHTFSEIITYLCNISSTNSLN